MMIKKNEARRHYRLGRCHACRRAFVWKPTPRIRMWHESSPCPVCGEPLHQTVHYARRKLTWYSLDGTAHPSMDVLLLPDSLLRHAPLVILKRRAKLGRAA